MVDLAVGQRLLQFGNARVGDLGFFKFETLQFGQSIEMCQPGCSGSSVCYAVIIDSPIWRMINTALTIVIASPNRVLAGDCPFVKPKLAMIVSINWTGMFRITASPMLFEHARW